MANFFRAQTFAFINSIKVVIIEYVKLAQRRCSCSGSHYLVSRVSLEVIAMNKYTSAVLSNAMIQAYFSTSVIALFYFTKIERD